ncbi:MAG: adenylate kinase [Candidatus Methanofastidiosia archaeon]
MRIIILGPPGSGKGTQAKLISQRFSIPHISSGDLLRDAISKGTELGKKARDYIEKGLLVPDEVVFGLMDERLKERDTMGGFILDGFPRNLRQAHHLEKILSGKSMDLVIYLDVPEEVIVERFSGRRSCKKCGRVYHLKRNPPAKDEICDSCGEKLIKRRDDEEDVVRKRIQVFKDQTQPLIAHYKKYRKLKKVNGKGEVLKVFSEILSELEKG